MIKESIKNKDLEDIPEIKKYFSRIFTVIHKDVRDKLSDLDLPNDKKKILKTNLAFLSKKNQIKYLNELERLYG